MPQISPALQQAMQDHQMGTKQQPADMQPQGQPQQSPQGGSQPSAMQQMMSMRGDMTGGAREALGSAGTGEAQLILKALIDHLKKITPDVNAQPTMTG